MFPGSGFYNYWIILFVWPLAITCLLTLMISIAVADVQRDERGNPTKGGKHLIRSRTYLISAFGAYALILVLVHVLIDPQEYRFMFWDKYEFPLLLLILTGDALAVVSAIYAFKAQAKGGWVLRIGTPIVSIISILATLSFPYRN